MWYLDPFWTTFWEVNHANKLLDIPRFSMNFTGFIDVCKRLGIRISFSVNSYESEYPKNDESGNIYESGKISSSVNLV